MARPINRIHTDSKASWKDNWQALRLLPRFFQLIWKTHKGLFIGNTVLRLVKSLLPVALLFVGKLIIDEVVIQMNASSPTWNTLWMWVGIEFGLALISDIFGRLINLSDGLLGDLYSNQSSVDLIEKAAKVSLPLLENPDFYDKLERARRQTNGRVSLMSDVLGQMQDLITVGSLLLGLIAFAPWLILLLIVSIVPSFINELKFSRTSYSLVRSWTPERRELDYLRYIGANDETAKEVKLFGLSSFIADRFSLLADRYYRANRKVAIQRTWWGAFFHIIGDLAYYGAYVFIISRTVLGFLSLGDLTFLGGSFNRLRNQLQGIFGRFTRITESALYLQDYFDFIDYPVEDETDRLPIIKEVKEGFEFRNVSFSYPNSDRKVLDGVSFFLEKGEKLALVGENGAGKTTLVKLLLRLYEPTEGEIYLDGVPITRYSREEYQQLFGAIFQDFVRYYFTAKDNIGVGKVEQRMDMDQIAYAAERSLANQVIEMLPEQYEEQLGRRFGKGKDLSGGEWQKVALARAYMKNAEVIILDEPTSSLDARAEFEAFERFIELTQDKTAILISHRFSTVRLADRIIVLKDGAILEHGTHEELLNLNGLYADLFTMQAAGYQ